MQDKFLDFYSGKYLAADEKNIKMKIDKMLNVSKDYVTIVKIILKEKMQLLNFL